MPAGAIAAYLSAKDENRPWLMERAFDPDATLVMVVHSDAIAFPPITQGREAITQLLVREFGRTYENVRTLCLDSPPRSNDARFSCDWLVGMSAKDGGAVRVGSGRYDWTFRAQAPHLAERLEITIDVMEVLAADHVAAVTRWLFALPWPWCPIQAAFASAPQIGSLEPLRRWADARTRPPGRMATASPQTFRGSCHCGAVTFEIVTDFPELTTCDCSICRRKNALMVKVHEGQFALLSGESSLTEYRFHTMTARHYFCKVCGIYPFHRKRVTPDYLGINVHCLEGFDPSGAPVRRTPGAAMK